MNNEQFILEAKGRTLTDEELIELLCNITPKSKVQGGIITDTVHGLHWSNESVNSVEEYLSAFTAEDFMDKHVKEAYSDYCQWCDLNNMEIQSNMLFTQSVQIYFNLKSKVIKSEGKSVRAYKSY